MEDKEAEVSAIYVCGLSRSPYQTTNSRLQMPYLVFSTQIMEEEDVYLQRESIERLDPVVQQTFEELRGFRETHNDLCDAYKDQPLHQSSTLDESYYHFALDRPSRQERKRRNGDQVVTKRLAEWVQHVKHANHDSMLYWPLIRVNQIWIWILDDSKSRKRKGFKKHSKSKNGPSYYTRYCSYI